MRIRSIKPEFWRSKDISDLTIEDRLLFIGLWSYVDDNGVGKFDVAIIAADLFAHDLSREPTETLSRVSTGCNRLSEKGLVTLYRVENRDYIFISAWESHQRVNNPNKPRFPRPSAESENLSRPYLDPIETLPPGTGEQGNRGTEGQGIYQSGFSDEKTEPQMRSDIEEVLDYLDAHLAEAELPIPNRTKHNISAVRLMIDKDGHPVEEIKAAIDWTFRDEFWRTNIRSASKLREKWGQLKGAAERARNKQRAAASPPLSRSDQIYIQEMQRIQAEENQTTTQLAIEGEAS